MAYYQDQSGKLYFLDSAEFAHVLPQGCEPISDEQAEAILNAPLSPEQQIAANIGAIQRELDRQAQARGYDNIVSACSYAPGAAGDPFAAEGVAFLAWRSAVWSHAYAVLAEVQAGTRPMPTPDEAVAMMPALVLPA